MPRAVLALTAILVWATPAIADDAKPPERRIEDPLPAVIAADVLATTMIAGGAALAYKQRNCTSHGCGQGGIIMVGIGAMGYVGWPASIHHDAGRSGRAFGSGALRVTLPLAGVAVAQVFERDAPTTVMFAAGGAMSAMLIDWLVLARYRREADAPARSLHAVPIDGGAIAGISGVF